MNRFPFSPFIALLQAQGFYLTHRDYINILTVMHLEGRWTRTRLKFTLQSLIIKTRDDHYLFDHIFNDYFQLADQDIVFTDLDINEAKKDLHELALKDAGLLERFIHKAFSEPRRPKISVRHRRSRPPQPARKSWIAFGLMVLVVVGLLFFQGDHVGKTLPLKPVSEVISNKPVPKPPPIEMPDIERPAPKKPDIPKPPPVRPFIFKDWHLRAGISASLFALILLYVVILWKTHRFKLPKKLDVDKKGKKFFNPAIIGGKPDPWLDSDTLDHLADCLGYFESQIPGHNLNINQSINETAQKGIATPVFQMKKEIYQVLILEDRFGEYYDVNPVARELAKGLSIRGVPVMQGTFNGKPDVFQTSDHQSHQLDDWEDRRNGIFLMIFSDGKGFYSQEDAYVLEKLAAWPRVAWMEYREEKLWDESTQHIAKSNLLIYPATQKGVTQAMERFLTEQGSTQLPDMAINRNQISIYAGDHLTETIEMYLGPCLKWAQACAMIQPLTPGMADLLRKKYHAHLPPEMIQHLMTLPGTVSTKERIQFSPKVLDVLQAGFGIHRSKTEQADVLKTILDAIQAVEPKEKSSIQHQLWEWYYQRVNLALAPQKAIPRLAALGAKGSELSGYIHSEMKNVNAQRITTRNEKDKQILSWLCKGTFKHYKPVAIWHKVLIALLLVCFLGVNGWLAKDFWGVYRIHRLILAEKSKSCEEHLPEMGLVIKRCFECKDDKGEVLSFYRLYDNNKPKDIVVTIGISFYPGGAKGQCPVDTLFYVVDDQKLSSVFAYISEYLGDLNTQSELLLRYFEYAEVDFTLIKDLKNLTYLDLSNTQVSDVSGLKDLKNLTTLKLNGDFLNKMSIRDVSALKDLKNLTSLNLYRTQVSDVSALKDLKNLTSLDLSSTQVSDVSALKDLKNLTSLYLVGTQVSDVSALKDLKNLTSLYLYSTQVSDVSALKDLKNLTYLYLKYTQVSDVSGLKDLKNLNELYLSEEQQKNLKTQIQQLKKALPDLQIKEW
jgi:hypothetical protein